LRLELVYVASASAYVHQGEPMGCAKTMATATAIAATNAMSGARVLSTFTVRHVRAERARRGTSRTRTPSSEAGATRVAIARYSSRRSCAADSERAGRRS